MGRVFKLKEDVIRIMDYSIAIEQRDKYLYVRVRGDNVPATIMRYLKEAYEACRDTQCPNVLIEENLDGPTLGVLEVFEVVSKNSHVFPVVQRVACVDVNPAHDPARMKFAETVAVNRGLNVRNFATLSEAVTWIELGPAMPVTPCAS